MRYNYCFLILLLIALTTGCTEDGRNVQEILITSENVYSHIDKQKKIVEIYDFVVRTPNMNRFFRFSCEVQNLLEESDVN